MFCQNCGTKLTEGNTCDCTSKSVNGLNLETLEKALTDMESLAKGVRPANSKGGDGDKRTAKEIVGQVKDQVKAYGDNGEGDTEEEPKTTKGVEETAKNGKPSKLSFGKGGFMPPPPQEEEEEEEDPRRRREEEEEEEAQGGQPEFKSAGKKKAKKSFADDLLEQEPVKKAVDVSDFLESVVYQLGEMNDSLRADVAKSLNFAGYQQQFNVGLAKAMVELGTIVKGLTEKVQGLSKAPASVRKSDLTVNAIEKSFAGGDATNNELSKSQIAAKLADMFEKKENGVTDSDVLRAEMTGFVRDDLKAILGIENK